MAARLTPDKPAVKPRTPNIRQGMISKYRQAAAGAILTSDQRECAERCGADKLA